MTSPQAEAALLNISMQPASRLGRIQSSMATSVLAERLLEMGLTTQPTHTHLQARSLLSQSLRDMRILHGYRWHSALSVVIMEVATSSLQATQTFFLRANLPPHQRPPCNRHPHLSRHWHRHHRRNFRAKKRADGTKLSSSSLPTQTWTIFMPQPLRR